MFNNNTVSRKITRYLKYILTLLIAIGISACGGGNSAGDAAASGDDAGGGSADGGTGGNSTAEYNKRISETILDFDNNGQMDARFDYLYYPDGRLQMVTYTYIGDGTTDLYNPFYVTSTQRADSELSYDSNGNLSGYKITIDNGDIINDAVFTYNGSQFIRSDTTVTASGRSFLLVGQMSYENGLPSQFNLTSAGTPFIGYTFTYNADNQIVGSVKTSIGLLEVDTATYEWNMDGSLDKITHINSNGTRQEDLTYSNGLLQSRDFTSTLPRGTNATWLYTYKDGFPLRTDYDLNRDGSIDATETVIMENGACTPVYFNIPEDMSGTGVDGKPNSPNGIVWCG